MNLKRLSRRAMLRLIDDGIISSGEYRDESDRRNYIHQKRYVEFCNNKPIMPRDGSTISYELVLISKDRAPFHAIEFHRDRARMRLDDWNRVRVTFSGNDGTSRVSGVSVMHAILIAQSCGMGTVARIDWRTHKAVTRRELGELKTYENQKRKLTVLKMNVIDKLRAYVAARPPNVNDDDMLSVTFIKADPIRFGDLRKIVTYIDELEHDKMESDYIIECIENGRNTPTPDEWPSIMEKLKGLNDE